MIDLSDRLAIVTGAAGGIGRATALLLADLGADVVVTDVTPDVEDVTTAIEESGGTATPIRVDVTEADEVGRACDAVLEEYGRIDILANVAGIFPSQPLAEITKADWDRVIDVNLGGTFNWTQAALPAMRAQQYGRVVNVSSITGGLDGRSGEHAHYAASKAGVLGFTRSAAIDVGPDGITINAVLPGIVETGVDKPRSKAREETFIQRTPVRRKGRPEEIAALIAFLGSEHAGFITGASIPIDGGSSLDSK